MAERIFVIGATGFVGKYVVDELLKRKYIVRVLVRPGSEKALGKRKVEYAFGDVRDPLSVEQGMNGCRAVINLVGIIREFPTRGVTYQKLHVDAVRNIINSAKKNHIRRLLHMSALGVRAGTKIHYFRSKYEAEQLIIKSGLTYTIFRPSMIFGKEDISLNVIASMVRKFGVFAIFGDGLYRVQPVFAEDVAKAFANSLGIRKSHGKIYELGGPRTYTFRRLVETIADLVMHRIVVLHIPLFIGKPIVALLQNLRSFPMTREALEMLIEENITEDITAWKELKIEQTQFEDKALEYIGR